MICPNPPALLPGATGRTAVAEIERLRAAAQAAVGWLREGGAPVLVLGGAPPAAVQRGQLLSARAFGLRYEVAWGDGDGDGAGPGDAVALTAAAPLVAAYLLDGHDARYLGVRDPREARAALAGSDVRSVLVMGGGSARRRDGAPGYLDERAVPFDDELARRIGGPDLDDLADPDLALAARLLADLPAPLAVAAGLCRAPMQARLESYDAPYGVAQYVARWWRP